MWKSALLVLVFAYCVSFCVCDTTPAEVHIALAGNDGAGNSNSMSIVWTTSADTTTSAVWFGKASGVYDSVVTGVSSQYWKQAPFSHVVVLPALEPGTTYYYQCGDNVGGRSTEFSFTTASPDTESFKMAVFGDMGTKNSDESIALLSTLIPDVDLFFHVGDLSYADDAVLVASTYERVWTKYMDSIQDFTAIKPYMVLPGNHEAECHDPSCCGNFDVVGNFTAYNARFRMPSPESGGVLNMWYSFNYGPVHFVMMDTETDYPWSPHDGYISKIGGFGDQMAWLAADLAAAAAPEARAVRPWIVVAGHRPIYTTGMNQGSGDYAPTLSCKILQNALEPLLDKYHVDLFLSGHMHTYERTWPVFDSTQIESQEGNVFANPSHTIHIISGNAGNPEGNSAGGHPEAPWSAIGNPGFGIGIFEVVNRTTLHWTAQFSGKDEGTTAGQVMDEIYIVKDV